MFTRKSSGRKEHFFGETLTPSHRRPFPSPLIVLRGRCRKTPRTVGEGDDGDLAYRIRGVDGRGTLGCVLEW
jgi:hypothetical protein